MNENVWILHTISLKFVPTVVQIEKQKIACNTSVENNTNIFLSMKCVYKLQDSAFKVHANEVFYAFLKLPHWNWNKFAAISLTALFQNSVNAFLITQLITTFVSCNGSTQVKERVKETNPVFLILDLIYAGIYFNITPVLSIQCYSNYTQAYIRRMHYHKIIYNRHQLCH